MVAIAAQLGGCTGREPPRHHVERYTSSRAVRAGEPQTLEGTPMTDESYERFAKWQGITREQLGATSNLLLGLATGLLAFTTVLLLEKKLVVSCTFGFAVAACILLLA